MRDIGELLRRAREEKGLTLQEVQQETKIRTKYLEALERGDESAVPGEVYYRGFLRSYANFLGLDGSALAERHRRLKEAERSEVAPERTRPSRRRRKAALSPSLATALVALFLLACFAGWWAWQSGLLDRGPGATAPSGPVPGAGGTGPAPGSAAPPVGPGVASPPTSGGEPGGSGVSLERVSGPGGEIVVLVRGVERLEVKGAFSARCWVRVKADDQVREESIFPPGMERTWTARQTLTLRVGDAAALRLVANGKEVGRLGASGEVVDLTLRLSP